jgi:hypothetical protein
MPQGMAQICRYIGFEEQSMARMTEAEADALDELWTKTTPAIDTSRPGYFTEHMAHLVEVDDLTAAWLRAKADINHQSPAEIIGELVRERIADQVEA